MGGAVTQLLRRLFSPRSSMPERWAEALVVLRAISYLSGQFLAVFIYSLEAKQIFSFLVLRK